MPKRTTAQKKARALQAASGRPYTACLAEVLAATEPAPVTVNLQGSVASERDLADAVRKSLLRRGPGGTPALKR